MKLKTTVIATAVLSLMSTTAVQAAIEYTPEQAAQFKPSERIIVTGRFNAIYEASDAVSRRADKIGAYAFYIQSLDDVGESGNLRVVADVYPKSVEKATVKKNRFFAGVEELTQEDAAQYEPFDAVTVSGFYPSQPDLYEALAKKAKMLDAASFAVIRNVALNDGGNSLATAYVYKKDAPKRKVLTAEALIPADSEEGKALLAQGGEAAKKVKIPGVASSVAPSTAIGRFFETSSSKAGRTSVTLKNGYVIEEINKETAAQMAPFDSITFSGYYTTTPDVRYQVAKRAQSTGAKYYHITREWQENGGSVTISADLYK